MPKLEELGACHIAYGAAPEHYPVVGTALIAAMAEIAGEAWRPTYTEAWSTAFDLVAASMIAGAERKLSAPSPDRAKAWKGRPRSGLAQRGPKVLEEAS